MKLKLKKYLASNKVSLVLIMGLFMLATVGSTYAWWTASTQIEQTVTMGNLKLEAKFNPKMHVDYEPGTYAEIKGNLKNIGTLPAIVKIENASKITFAYSDDNLTKIAESDRVSESVDPNVIKLDCEPQSEDYLDNDKVYWYVDSKGDKYLLMEPKANLKLSILVQFADESSTNRYMDSILDAQAQLRATQVLEGAIEGELGVDYTDLQMLPLTKSIDFKQDRLIELIERGR